MGNGILTVGMIFGMVGRISIVGMIFGMVGKILMVGMIGGILVGGILERVGDRASVLVGCSVTVIFSNGMGMSGTKF